MIPKEKISRWSHLKIKGGADAEDEAEADAEAKAEAAAQITQEQRVSSDIHLPGGALKRNFVPPMAPLAPQEKDDDRLSLGVGHRDTSLPAPDCSSAQASNIMDDSNEVSEDLDEPTAEQLTKEQREVVNSLPSIDELDADSDFTVFLQENVPEFLRRRALKVLWKSNPIFGFLDGMNDYDEDYNVIDKILTLADSTGYQVGKGFLNDEELNAMMPEEARKAFDDEEQDAEKKDVEKQDVEKQDVEKQDVEKQDAVEYTSVNQSITFDKNAENKNTDYNTKGGNSGTNTPSKVNENKSLKRSIPKATDSS